MFLKILFSLVFCIIFFSPAFAQTDDYLYDGIIGAETSNLPKIMDENFLISEFTTGLNFPTTMEFVGNDILVLQKNDGLVRHVLQNGKILEEPVLDAKVSNYLERGMLGIVATKDSAVYLYYTESNEDGGEPIANNIYKYKWKNGELIEPELIKSLPSYPDAIMHQGGVMTVGNDNTVYAVIGDQDNQDLKHGANILQNQFAPPDNTGVIIPIDPEGPYFGIGIRNSFGITVDPETGYLWQTENGPDRFDEINLVEQNFNGGWNAHSGPISESKINIYELPNFVGVLKSHIQLFLSNIYAKFFLSENYVYSDPEFSWEKTISPTALSFAPNSFGKFQGELFVGDCIGGNIYKFKLNDNRDGFIFNDESLQDLIFSQGDDLDEILFADGFGCVTDIEFKNDKMFVVSLAYGKIYEISLN